MTQSQLIAVHCLGAVLAQGLAMAPLRAQSQSGTEVREQIVQLFSEACRARESTLDGLKAECLSVRRKVDANGCGVSLLTLDRSRLSERWVRLEGLVELEPRRHLEIVQSAVYPAEFQRGLSLGRPTLCVFDGARTLSIGPQTHQERLWTGQLAKGLDKDIRSGGFVCGWMFGEQWLSECLSKWTCVEAKPLAGEFELTFALSRPPSNAQRVKIVTSAKTGWAPMSMAWLVPASGGATDHAETKVQMQVNVSEFVEHQGSMLPCRGSVRYNYSDSIEFSVYLRYTSVAERSPMLFSVDALPPEVRAVDGVVIYRDDLTTEMKTMGNKEVLPPALRREVEEGGLPFEKKEGFLDEGDAGRQSLMIASWMTASFLLIAAGLHLRRRQRSEGERPGARALPLP